VSAFVPIALKRVSYMNNESGARRATAKIWRIPFGTGVICARGGWEGTLMNEKRKSQGESREQVYLFAVDERFFVL